METVGKRIKRLRERYHMSQLDLATRCGWDSQSRIGNYEAGLRQLAPNDALIIAEALNTSPGELLFGAKNTIKYQEIAGLSYRLLPILTNEQLITLQIIDEILSIPETEIQQYVIYDGTVSRSGFALYITDDCMETAFFQGDLIIIDPDIVPTPGDFVIAKKDNNNIIFNKFTLKASNHAILMPLNPDYPCSDSIKESITILGTLIEHRIYRKKRK